MVDSLTPEERSDRMSRIRGQDTKPEVLLRKALHASGFRYRLHDKRLPGKPDLVLPHYKAVVFVHGCFWHCHPGCKASHVPKTNAAFWESKFSRNVARDARNVNELMALGWRVFTVWECSTNTKAKAGDQASKLAVLLRGMPA